MAQKRKILLVDDEQNFVKMVQINLEMTGRYEARIEVEGRKGLEAVRDFHPELVILDVVMRDMSGPDVARQIRAEKEFKHLPIIFLTAMTESEIAPEKLGGEHFELLQKPVSIEDLVHSIEKHLGGG